MADRGETPGARVTRLPVVGMVALKADLADPRLAAALDGLGLPLPGRRRIATGRAGRAAWMAPDELLILCTAEGDAGLAADLGTALAGVPHLAAAVGDARVRFAVEGAGAATALAKLAPVDVASLGPDEIRRSRLGQIAAAFWRSRPEGLPEGFVILCARSLSGHAEALLATAARHVAGIVLP